MWTLRGGDGSLLYDWFEKPTVNELRTVLIANNLDNFLYEELIRILEGRGLTHLSNWMLADSEKVYLSYN